jgi:hypothetical protein
MIAISNLSANYIKEITTAEATAVVGGLGDFDSYNAKISAVDIKQLNLASFATTNFVGAVITNQ